MVETKLRVPGGDAVHRVWAVADHGGLTVIEVENDSPMPIAVQVITAPWREDIALRIAYALEQAGVCSAPRPKL